MNTKPHLPKILCALIFVLILLGASATAPVDRPTSAGGMKDSIRSAPIVLAQFVPCPNGRCRR